LKLTELYGPVTIDSVGASRLEHGDRAPQPFQVVWLEQVVHAHGIYATEHLFDTQRGGVPGSPQRDFAMFDN
jgi:hypothetical protein